jgi:DNA adenine methylase
MNSPVSYIGSKRKLVRHLLGMIPKHRCYVEPFGGGASLLFAKEQAPMEVYNDIDEGVVTFFKVLRDESLCQELITRLTRTPCSRKLWEDCRGSWRRGRTNGFEESESLVDRAWRWYIVNRQSWNGHFATAWGHTVQTRQNVDNWLRGVEELEECGQRMRQVAVEWKPYEWILDKYDAKDTLFYCDPPYVPDTVNQAWKPYPGEMGVEQHGQMVQQLLKVKGMVILSGYDHWVYAPLPRNGWLELRRKVHSSAAGTAKQVKSSGKMGRTEMGKREEVLWLSSNLVAQREREDV